jgi:tetratricopeptide (TPR) repeat protein
VALFRARGLALAAASAFALHPIHTEAVANVVGRAELLSFAFLFLSWWLYLKWDEARTGARTRWLFASVAAFALALLSKEHAAVLLTLLILTDLLRASEKGLSLSRTIWKKCRTAYGWYLAALAGYLVVRALVLEVLLTSHVHFVSNPLVGADLWTRNLTAIKILGKYLWLLLAPVHLSSDYSYNQVPLSGSLIEPAVLAALLGLLAMLVLAIWSWRRQAGVSVAVAIFVISVLPVSNVPFLIGTIMAERVLYLPSLGWCLLLAVAVTTLAARRRWRLVTVGAFVLLLLGYGTRTVIRNRDWRGNLELFAAATRSSPNSASAQRHLGSILLQRGDLADARQALERSLEIYPEYSEAHNTLGLILEKQREIDAALLAYQTAIRLNPEDRLPHLNLGFLYVQKGMTSDALGEFRQVAQLGAFRVDDFNRLAKGFFLVGSVVEAQESLEKSSYYTPDSFVLRNNLGLTYLRQGRWENAQRELEAAARLMPDSPEVQMNLGRVFAARGLPGQAEAALKASLRLQPANPNALNFLGLVLADQGRLADAEKVLQTAIRLRPEGPDPHYTLGVVFEKQGRLLDAQREFEAALRFKPQLIPAHRALGAVLQKRGKIGDAQRQFKLAEDQEKLLKSGAPGYRDNERGETGVGGNRRMGIGRI